MRLVETTIVTEDPDESSRPEGVPPVRLVKTTIVTEDPDESSQPAVTVARRMATATSGGRVRAATVPSERLSRSEKREACDDGPPVEWPQTRGECAGGPRPCPRVGCKYNLYLDINPESGAVKFNFPHLEVWEMEESCALDVAERNGVTLEEVGAIVNLTRERIRQMELTALTKMRSAVRTDPGPGEDDVEE